MTDPHQTKLGRDWKIEVGAQGIEKTAQCESLRELGCRLGQGYFFSAPTPIPLRSFFESTLRQASPLLAPCETSLPFPGVIQKEISIPRSVFFGC